MASQDNLNNEFDVSAAGSGGGISLCERFARILGSEILVSRPGLCAVTRVRDIRPTIAGIPTRSPLVINALFSFEQSGQGRTLNLGETVILQEEINPFISALRRQGILVTALHNHWLFDNPRLFYIHFFSVEDPLSFARKVARAFQVLEDSTLYETDLENENSGENDFGNNNLYENNFGNNKLRGNF